MTAKQASEGLLWTPHPVADVLVPPLTLEAQRAWLKRPGGQDTLMEYWESHEGLIKDAAADPLAYGFELPFWQDVRWLLERKSSVFALGGNGPGKTEIGGKMAVEALCKVGGQGVICVAKDENVSKQLQQRAVYKYLPPAYRDFNEKVGGRKRAVVTKVNYSQANGFTEGTFVLPTKSQMWFKTVEQYERKNDVFEGPEYDFAWVDEPSPVELVNTLEYRVGKKNGKFFFSFTAVNGYDAVCASILEGAKVLKSLPMNWRWKLDAPKAKAIEPAERMAEIDTRGAADKDLRIPELNTADVQVKGLPPGHMPYIMQPMDQSKAIIFLWTHWNVFLPQSTQ